MYLCIDIYTCSWESPCESLQPPNLKLKYKDFDIYFSYGFCGWKYVCHRTMVRIQHKMALFLSEAGHQFTTLLMLKNDYFPSFWAHLQIHTHNE